MSRTYQFNSRKLVTKYFFFLKNKFFFLSKFSKIFKMVGIKKRTQHLKNIAKTSVQSRQEKQKIPEDNEI